MSACLSLAERLVLARHFVEDPPPAPTHVHDQLAAAAVEAQQRLMVLYSAWAQAHAGQARRSLAHVEPVRASRLVGGSGAEVVLWAAGLGCSPCRHLHRMVHQPMLVLLPLRLVLCRRCVRTVRHPPVDEVDRCDVCGSRGNTTFSGFRLWLGPVVFAGDVAPCCGWLLEGEA